MDKEFEAQLRLLITYIIEDVRKFGLVVGAVLVTKALERIGHHAQNLAEYIIFQIKGEDIRSADNLLDWADLDSPSAGTAQ